MSETSSYFKSSIPNFGRYGDQFISMWEFGIAPNLFFSIYPAILIYLIEFQNVTFRRLAKSCERQPKAAPIAAYILALSLISGILATIVYFITKELGIIRRMPKSAYFTPSRYLLFLCGIHGRT